MCNFAVKIILSAFIWNQQVEQLCQTFNMSHRYKRGVEIPAQQLLRGLVKQDSLSFIERKSSTFGPPQNIWHFRVKIQLTSVHNSVTKLFLKYIYFFRHLHFHSSWMRTNHNTKWVLWQNLFAETINSNFFENAFTGRLEMRRMVLQRENAGKLEMLRKLLNSRPLNKVGNSLTWL